MVNLNQSDLTFLSQLPKVEKIGWPWDTAFDPERYNGQSIWPKISIVIPTFNQGNYIEETLRSILLQQYPALQLIVIDGKSTDETVSILKKYEPWIDYWVSEQDRGQTHAINKGIEQCTGTIFNWVNSDDFLEKGALHHIGRLYNEKKWTVLAGAVRNFNDEGPLKVIHNHNLNPVDMLIKKYDNMKFHQPGVWLTVEGVKSIGGLNEEYNYCFDWHMVIRYLLKQANVVYTDQVLTNFRLHGASKTESFPLRFQEENLEIAKELSKDTYFKGNKEIQEWINQKDAIIQTIKIDQQETGKWHKTQQLVTLILTYPAGWNKYTLGALKKVLLG